MRIYVFLICVVVTHQHSMTLLMEIEQMLSQNKGFSSVQARVEQYKNQLKSEQQKHDQFYQVQKEECDKEIQMRKNQIESTYRDLSKANIRLEHCEAEQQRNTINFEQLKRQLSSYQERLQSVSLIRSQIELDSKQKEESYMQSLQTINEVIDMLEHKGNRGQITSLSQRMIHEAVQTESIELYGPALKILNGIKLHEEDSAKVLKVILQMFEELKGMISQKLLSSRNENTKSLDLLDQQKKRFKQTIHRQLAQRDRLKQEIEMVIECVGDSAAEVQVLTSRLQMTKEQHRQAQSMCGAFQEEFKEISRLRKEDILQADSLEAKARERMAREDRLRSDI